jgi:hypothetical protein
MTKATIDFDAPDLAKCAERASLDAFRGRIERTMEQGPVDLEIGWPGDYGDPQRELRIRVQRGAMAVHRAR